MSNSPNRAKELIVEETSTAKFLWAAQAENKITSWKLKKVHVSYCNWMHAKKIQKILIFMQDSKICKV